MPMTFSVCLQVAQYLLTSTASTESVDRSSCFQAHPMSHKRPRLRLLKAPPGSGVQHGLRGEEVTAGSEEMHMGKALDTHKRPVMESWV